MAIVYDNSASDSGGPASSRTFSYTVTGANPALIVYARTNETNVNHITGITYAGVSLTFLYAVTGAGDGEFYAYYLLNPATGANNLVVNFDASIYWDIVPVSYNGVSATAIDASGSSGQTGGSSFTRTLTTIANNAWVVGMFASLSSSTNTIGSTNATFRKGGQGQTDGNNYWAVYDYGPKTPAGNVSQTVNASSGTPNWWAFQISLAPAATTVNQSSTLSMLGVGH